jgi:hypothetical protein
MQSHNANALESLNLTSNMQRSKRDEWEGSCLAQSAHKYVKCSRERALSRSTSIYRRTPSNRAVRNLTAEIALDRTRWSNWPDALVSWAALNETTTRRAEGTWPNATVPASGYSPVSSLNDQTRPIISDQTRLASDHWTEKRADTEH